MLSPPKIRVLRLIARLNVGGPARHVAWVTQGLDRERFEQLLAAGRVEADEDDMGPELRARGVEYLEIPKLSRSLRPGRDLSCLFKLVGLMLRFRPQVVETHTSKAGFLGRAALLIYRPLAWLSRRPIPKAVHTFHGHTFHGYFGPVAGAFFLGLERFLASAATWRIVVLSPQQREEIQGRFRVGKPGQFIILPLGIDPVEFAPDAGSSRAFRAELGMGENDFVVGAVGRVAPVKNYALLVEIAARIKDLRPDIWQHTRFVLIGGGSEEEMAALAQRAAELGVAERVIFAGNRSDPRAFYGAMDALLLTSTNEGTPMVILEAGAAGLPVVATEVGGVPDLLGEAESTSPDGFNLRARGLSAPSGEAGALAQALIWLAEHPADSAGLTGRLGEMVARDYHRDRLLADLTRLYEKACRC